METAPGAAESPGLFGVGQDGPNVVSHPRERVFDCAELWLFAVFPESDIGLSSRNQRRRRTHKSKSVMTTEEVVINRFLKIVFVFVAIGVAAYLTMAASRL